MARRSRATPCAEDQTLADVMTDKATVEIPSPVAGTVLALGGKVGEVLAVGTELIRLEVDGAGNVGAARAGASRRAGAHCAGTGAPRRRRAPRRHPRRRLSRRLAATGRAARRTGGAGRLPRAPGDKPARLAGGAPPRLGARHRPAVRRRQRPGRPHHARRPRRLRGASAVRRDRPRPPPRYAERDDEEAVPVIGLRRKIAQKMQESKRRIPHFTYVEEVDVTELEALRARLNAQCAARRAAASRCCRS